MNFKNEHLFFMLFHFRQCKKKNRNTIYFEDKSKHSSPSYSFSLLHLGARRGSQMTVSPSRFSSSKCFSNLSNACGARVEIITQDFLQPHFTRWMVCVCVCVSHSFMECHGKHRCTQVYRVFECIFGARFRAVWAPSTAG